MLGVRAPTSLQSPSEGHASPNRVSAKRPPEKSGQLQNAVGHLQIQIVSDRAKL